MSIICLSGCTKILGMTGADEGRRINENWVEYNVIHPGLTIKILEPYSADLMRIQTVGKTSPSPLKHTVVFGGKENSHELKIMGRYKKDLYLDGLFYGSTWYGDLVIKDGAMTLNGKLMVQQDKE